MLFFSREATSEIYGPRSILYHICFEIYFYSLLFLDLLFQNPKIPFWTFYYLFYFVLLRDLFIQNHQTNPSFARGGIDNPSYASGCKYLFFMCRYRLHIVAWFSYWIDNLGFITEGNTYHSCTASPLPLLGKTDAVSSRITYQASPSLISARPRVGKW